MSGLKGEAMTPAPPINPETRPFWEAANEGRLALGYCAQCLQWHYYPRSICPFCQQAGAGLRDAAGRGHVYSCSATLKGAPEPYVLAYVELDEGPRMLSNIVECAPLDVAIGQRVELCYVTADGGQQVAMFRPAKRDMI